MEKVLSLIVTIIIINTYKKSPHHDDGSLINEIS
jgi:hypothetical protein